MKEEGYVKKITVFLLIGLFVCLFDYILVYLLATFKYTILKYETTTKTKEKIKLRLLRRLPRQDSKYLSSPFVP
jgi:hypothetical protein